MTTNVSAHVAPQPMEGHGAYNRNARVQAAGIAAALELVEAAAARATIAEGAAALTIADYGASQGHNSLAPMAAAIAGLRRHTDPGRPVMVVHTDLPGNDFQALFDVLWSDPASYLVDGRNIFASAIGRSFYEQLLPDASVTLGWSSWAVQWLSRTPGEISDQVQVAWSQDAEARETFTRQSREDWRRFLSMRAAELVPGGTLVVLTMALHETEGFGYRPLLDALYEALLQEVASGLISSDELQRMVIPTVGRSEADIREPFVESGSFAGLSIEAADIFLEPDRIFMDHEMGEEAARFGARWAAFSRASVFPSLAAALRDPGSAAPFMDRLEEALAARLAAAPQPMAIPLVRVLLRKSDQA